MPNTTTIAALSDSTNAINQIGVAGDSGVVVRDRWNQVASVQVTDADDAIYTSQAHGYPWVRGDSQHSAEHVHTTPDWIQPMPAIGAS